MKYAVIDISSSSISLTAADDKGGEPFFRARESLTLLHYMDGHALSRRGIEKLIEAVLAMQEKCRSVGVDMLYLISTAALRAVLNIEEVHEEIFSATGIPLNFIDGETEAYCDYVANRSYGEAEGGAVLLDVGGASTEICDLSHEDREGLCCLDFGILTLRKKFVEKIQPGAEEAERIRKFLKKRFKKAGLPKKGAFDTIVLAGATNLALYAVYAEFTKTHTVGERVMDLKKFRKLTEHLLSGAGRAKLILDVAPDKLYAVGLAAVVAEALCKRFGAEKIVVSNKGVKEGYLELVRSGSFRGAYYDFSQEAGAKARSVPQSAAEGVSAGPRKERKAGAEIPSAAQGAEPAAQPAKRRGRPAKAKEEGAEPAARPAATGEAQPAKRRGRPAKTKEEGAEPSAQPAATGEAQPAKRRGRPAKAKKEGAEPAAQPAATGEAQPAKRRGRPPKAKAPEQNGDGEENV